MHSKKQAPIAHRLRCFRLRHEREITGGACDNNPGLPPPSDQSHDHHAAHHHAAHHHDPSAHHYRTTTTATLAAPALTSASQTTSLPHRLQRLRAAPRAQHSVKCARAFVSFWGHCAALRTLRDLKMSTRTQCTDRHRVSWPLLRGARSTATRLHEIVNSGITSRGRRG